MIALALLNWPQNKKMGHRRSRAAMQSIAEWLEDLGLGHYAERFAENGVDFSVLRHLTDQDLKDIGILLGHRRKMLAAIAELAGAVPATLQPRAAIELKPHDAAERRQLTVMFTDLVGSTALSARLDPPRRSEGDHQHLSSTLRGGHRQTWRFRRQIPGRRHTCLFRLSPRTRGQCRARGACGAGIGRGEDEARWIGNPLATAGRHRHRSSRRRRSLS